MNILYLSALSSAKLIDELYQYTKKDPGFAVQKFNRLLVQGLIKNKANVTIISAPPINRQNSPNFFWTRSQEVENNISYNYLGFVNFPILRQLCLVISSFVEILLWIITKKKGRNDVIICDVLNASICLSIIFICKITRTQCIGVMTDMPGLMVNFEKKEKKTYQTRFATKLIKWCLRNFNKYVFLTEAMNVVNEKQCPFIVMEGISDGSMVDKERTISDKTEKIIMYAGGLHERYGLKKLVNAFMRLPYENVCLKLYGSGPFKNALIEKYCKEDQRILYMGLAPNKEVVEAELDATLLVNPRPTNEQFTLYSFPSKNIEYMASGTPLLTTKLPGMPKEYYSYVLLIENETIEGYTNALENAINKSDEELYLLGSKAKEFVIKQKNSVEQARRVIELIKL